MIRPLSARTHRGSSTQSTRREPKPAFAAPACCQMTRGMPQDAFQLTGDRRGKRFQSGPITLSSPRTHRSCMACPSSTHTLDGRRLQQATSQWEYHGATALGTGLVENKMCLGITALRNSGKTAAAEAGRDDETRGGLATDSTATYQQLGRGRSEYAGRSDRGDLRQGPPPTCGAQSRAHQGSKSQRKETEGERRNLTIGRTHTYTNCPSSPIWTPKPSTPHGSTRSEPICSSERQVVGTYGSK